MDFNWTEAVTLIQPYTGHMIAAAVTLIIGLLGGFMLAGRSYRNFILNGILFGSDSFTVSNEMAGVLRDENSALLGVISNPKNVDPDSISVTINGLRYTDMNFQLKPNGEVWWAPGNDYEIEAGDEVVLDYRHGRLVPLVQALARPAAAQEAQPTSTGETVEELRAIVSHLASSPNSVYYRGRAFFKLVPMTDLDEGDIFVIFDESKGHVGGIMTAASRPRMQDDKLVIEGQPILTAQFRPCWFCGETAPLRKLPTGMEGHVCDNCTETTNLDGALISGESPSFDAQLPDRLPPIMGGKVAKGEALKRQKRAFEDLGIDPDELAAMNAKLDAKLKERADEQRGKTPKYRFWGVTKKGQIVADACTTDDLKEWAESRKVWDKLGLMGNRPIPKDVLKRFALAPGTLTDKELAEKANAALDAAADQDARDSV